MSTVETVVSFWLDELSPADWYNSSPDLDAQITDRFQDTWTRAMAGELGFWLTYPTGALAYIILTDQFPRNMYRDTEDAFASDPLARAVAKRAIHEGWDMRIDPPARQFFYMPLMHSELLSDQDRAVRLFKTRMPDSENSLLHARAHREVIRSYGRFPTRNLALGRHNTAPEAAYLADGGYGTTLRAMQD